MTPLIGFHLLDSPFENKDTFTTSQFARALKELKPKSHTNSKPVILNISAHYKLDLSSTDGCTSTIRDVQYEALNEFLASGKTLVVASRGANPKLFSDSGTDQKEQVSDDWQNNQCASNYCNSYPLCFKCKLNHENDATNFHRLLGADSINSNGSRATTKWGLVDFDVMTTNIVTHSPTGTSIEVGQGQSSEAAAILTGALAIAWDDPSYTADTVLRKVRDNSQPRSASAIEGKYESHILCIDQLFGADQDKRCKQ